MSFPVVGSYEKKRGLWSPRAVERGGTERNLLILQVVEEDRRRVGDVVRQFDYVPCGGFRRGRGRSA